MEQFVTCSQDKQVHLWDTNSHQPLWSKTIEVTVCWGVEMYSGPETSGLEGLKCKVFVTKGYMYSFMLSLLQDPGRSAGFHPSGGVLAVGTMTGRSASQLHCRNTTFRAGSTTIIHHS